MAHTPAERERLVILAWDSLAAETGVAADHSIDRDGLEIAARCEVEISAGDVRFIDHSDFLRRTGGGRE